MRKPRIEIRVKSQKWIFTFSFSKGNQWYC